MNEIFREELKKLITIDKKELLANVNVLKEIINKINKKEYKKEYFIVFNSFNENIPQEIILANGIKDISILKERLIERLEDNLGFSKETALWAVETWMYVLGMINDFQDSDINQNTEKNQFTLKKDEFETEEEWRNRILKANPVSVGYANFSKEKYDIETGKFPTIIEFNQVIYNIDLLKSDTYIIVNRDIARDIYNSEKDKNVYLSFDFNDYGLYVKKVEVEFQGFKIPIINAMVKIKIENDDLKEKILKFNSEEFSDKYIYKDEHIYNEWKFFIHSTGNPYRGRSVGPYNSDYDNIYKSKIGSNQIYRLNSYESKLIKVVDGWIYFINTSLKKLCKMDTNGDNLIEVCSIDSFINKILEAYLFNNQVYYSQVYYNQYDTKKYQLNVIDTNNDRKYTLFESSNVLSIVDINESYIYYEVKEYPYPTLINRINLETNEIETEIEFKLDITLHYDRITYNSQLKEIYIIDISTFEPVIHKIHLI